MKLLNTSKDFYSEIIKMAKEKPSFFYMATYHIKVDDNIKSIIYSLPDKCDVKVIIGVNQDASINQVNFLKKYFEFHNVKVFKDCHLKLIVSNKGAIIGGRNLTDSGWMDLSIKLINKDTILKVKNEFLKHYKKRGI